MDLNQWKRVRYRVIVEGVSKRSVMREEGLHWETLERMLNNEAPPGYQRAAPPKGRKLDEYIPWLEEVLRADQSYPRKQRHTIKRLHERLRKALPNGGRKRRRLAIAPQGTFFGRQPAGAVGGDPQGAEDLGGEGIARHQVRALRNDSGTCQAGDPGDALAIFRAARKDPHRGVEKK